jgi:hypothetical protein
MKKLLAFIFVTFVALPLFAADVDWQTFLAKQDPVWVKMPQKFNHGAFLGNGLLGATIFQDGNNQIRFEIGRSDVTDPCVVKLDFTDKVQVSDSSVAVREVKPQYYELALAKGLA